MWGIVSWHFFEMFFGEGSVSIHGNRGSKGAVYQFSYKIQLMAHGCAAPSPSNLTTDHSKKDAGMSISPMLTGRF